MTISIPCSYGHARFAGDWLCFPALVFNLSFLGLLACSSCQRCARIRARSRANSRWASDRFSCPDGGDSGGGRSDDLRFDLSVMTSPLFSLRGVIRRYAHNCGRDQGPNFCQLCTTISASRTGIQTIQPPSNKSVINVATPKVHATRWTIPLRSFIFFVPCNRVVRSDLLKQVDCDPVLHPLEHGAS